MADFEPPSFSLGLDFDQFSSDPLFPPETLYTHPSSPNQLPVSIPTFYSEDNEFENLVVDDSEPESTDSPPKLKRLRRGLVLGATSSSSPVSEKAVIDDEDFDVLEDRFTDQHLFRRHHVVCTSSNFWPNRVGVLNNQPVKGKQHMSNDGESVSTSCDDMVFPKLVASPLKGYELIDSDSDDSDPVVSRKCNGSDWNSKFGKCDDLPRHAKREQTVSTAWEDLPKAYCYFFHDDPRIQELVRSRLPNFSPLGSMLNIDVEQPSASEIDYMGQFRVGESSRQAARTNKDKKSSTCRKILRKTEAEETSEGWVNPKLGVDKAKTKKAVERKVNSARQTAGHWLTGLDGKKVYVGKSGRELTGRVAYMQYKKESGLGFKKVKRKSITKKKK